MDFFVLIVSLVELGIALADRLGYSILSGNKTADKIIFVKIIRLVRFVRLLRWARPILPNFKKLIEIRINARLFKGCDIGKYIHILVLHNNDTCSFYFKERVIYTHWKMRYDYYQQLLQVNQFLQNFEIYWTLTDLK